MKIMHIASHKGNIGDMINHNGFYSKFAWLLRKAEVNNVEIRDFYYSAQNKQSFNADFAEIINSYDLCILGGGGFFDVQWAQSSTGTTFDFSKNFIDNVKIPIIVNAIGYHEYPGKTTQEICDKFKAFLSHVLQRSNWLVTVRNDGSYERLKNRYGYSLTSKILKVPDNGFYCAFQTASKADTHTLGLCITNDLFSSEYNKSLTEKEFNEQISLFILTQIAKGWEIILFPHTPADLYTIVELLKIIPSNYKRNSIIVAPYDANSNKAINQIGMFYNQCSCVIGMRFHSLITALNLRIPSIALAGHTQIESLFKELGLSDYCVQANNYEIAKKLDDMCENILDIQDALKKKYDLIYHTINVLSEQYQNKIKNFLQF